jgi:hypothetical protein
MGQRPLYAVVVSQKGDPNAGSGTLLVDRAKAIAAELGAGVAGAQPVGVTPLETQEAVPGGCPAVTLVYSPQIVA